MSDRVLRAALAVLALAGSVVAGYMLYSRYSGAGLVCSTGGCETVQSSSYAELAGVPVAAFGLLGYVLIAATAFAAGPIARAAGAALSLAALVFSTYLLVIQLTVIDAVCDWCLASDGIITALAGLALLRLRPELPRGAAANPHSFSA